MQKIPAGSEKMEAVGILLGPDELLPGEASEGIRRANEVKNLGPEHSIEPPLSVRYFRVPISLLLSSLPLMTFFKFG